jgi:hypothetical protein
MSKDELQMAMQSAAPSTTGTAASQILPLSAQGPGKCPISAGSADEL